MMRSLYSAVSGLKTHQTKMDVVGNNIANVNTVGFKSSSVVFSEIMYQTVSGASGASATTGKGGVNAKQIGLGVSTGSTTVSIESAGAAETTGNPFDIRLSDKNSTNFFVVNDGSQNLFTRSGSFYIDGSGNLAMSSTGYTLMGWQVDESTGEIRKDTVSALRIMQEKNLTSAPEATSKGVVGGVLDKNDTNVSSESGYNMNLSFYDALGYSYTAKFSIKSTENSDEGTYTVELSDILDADGKTILTNAQKANMSQLFGRNTTGTRTYDITDSNIKYTDTAITQGATTIPANSYYYEVAGYVQNPDNTITAAATYQAVTVNNDGTYSIPAITYYATEDDCRDGNLTTIDAATGTMAELYGVSADVYNASTVQPNGQIQYSYPTTNYTLQFSKDDGTFSYVNQRGTDAVTLNLATVLGDKFSNIDIDFSQMKNFDNGGSSTVGMDTGSVDGTTIGAGKALGALTGLSVNPDGKIYGSYDNGNTVLLGQIAVAQFANASGLEKIGENCYTTTLNSGDFDGIGVEISADGSSMATGQLEMSNVDLSSEFTSMIVTQRGFQANSRVITTSDTLLEELINLKR